MFHGLFAVIERFPLGKRLTQRSRIVSHLYTLLVVMAANASGSGDAIGTPLVVTIDGPAGAGKTSIARRAAGALGLAYLDTGAMMTAHGIARSNAGVLRAQLRQDRETAVADVAADEAPAIIESVLPGAFCPIRP